MDWVWVCIAALIAWVIPMIARLNKFLIVTVVVISPLIVMWLSISVIDWQTFRLAPKGQFLLLFTGITVALTLLFKLVQRIRD